MTGQVTCREKQELDIGPQASMRVCLNQDRHSK